VDLHPPTPEFLRKWCTLGLAACELVWAQPGARLLPGASAAVDAVLRATAGEAEGAGGAPAGTSLLQHVRCQFMVAGGRRLLTLCASGARLSRATIRAALAGPAAHTTMDSARVDGRGGGGPDHALAASDGPTVSPAAATPHHTSAVTNDGGLRQGPLAGPAPLPVWRLEEEGTRLMAPGTPLGSGSFGQALVVNFDGTGVPCVRKSALRWDKGDDKAPARAARPLVARGGGGHHSASS
jgi:hypothetical protein